MINDIAEYEKAKNPTMTQVGLKKHYDELQKALLQYRREHNIFEVGDPKKSKQTEDWRCAVGEFEQGRDTSELNYKELQKKGVFDLPYKAFQFMQSQQSKIEQLEKGKAEITRLVQSLRNEFDLNSDCIQVERQIKLLEKASRETT